MNLFFLSQTYFSSPKLTIDFSSPFSLALKFKILEMFGQILKCLFNQNLTHVGAYFDNFYSEASEKKRLQSFGLSSYM